MHSLTANPLLSKGVLPRAGAASSEPALPPTARRLLGGTVVALHLAGAWGLMQIDSVREAVSDVLPLQIDWIAPPAPTPAAPPPPRPAAAPAPRTQPVVATSATPSPPVANVTAPAPELTPSPAPSPSPAPALAPATAPAAAAAPTPPAPVAAPATPRQIPASAVRYLVPPAQVYPPASRRLQEQGTVLLRLVVDVNGLPQRVSLHQSSGHPRLDEQALQAMRAARFKPHTDNGVPVEWTAIAPLAYELD